MRNKLEREERGLETMGGRRRKRVALELQTQRRQAMKLNTTLIKNLFIFDKIIKYDKKTSHRHEQTAEGVNGCKLPS